MFELCADNIKRLAPDWQIDETNNTCLVAVAFPPPIKRSVHVYITPIYGGITFSVKTMLRAKVQAEAIEYVWNCRRFLRDRARELNNGNREYALVRDDDRWFYFSKETTYRDVNDLYKIRYLLAEGTVDD